jgi:WD40 repeat protein
MIKTTNIVVLVGGGKNPRFPLNQIIIWDDSKKRILRIIRLNSTVLNIKAKMDRIIGVTDKKIYIFNIHTLRILDMYNTFENTNGIIGFSSGDFASVLAFPFESKGKVKVINSNSTSQLPVIQAHESKIACLSVSQNGSLLATASDKGTLIRVYNVVGGKLLTEVRRGSTSAEIRCIVFDEFNKYVGCASGMGTIHIFSIVSVMKNLSENYYSENIKEEPKNRKSFLKKFNFFDKINSSYLNSEWSFAKFRINEHKSIFTFLDDNKICVLTSDGKYYIASFDPKKEGECIKLKEKYIYDINKNNK